MSRPLAAVVSRRLLRNPVWRRIVLVTAGAVACLCAAFVVLSALNLSGPQVAERDLGRFDVRAEAGAAGAKLLPGDDRAVLAAGKAATAAGASSVFAGLKSLDVQPDTASPPFTRYLEGPWDASAFPDRYILTSGRWPRAAGEVVVTSPLLPDVRRGAVSVLAGNATFSVTGTVRDRFSSDALFLAARGTWAHLDAAALRGTFPLLSAAPIVLWSGGDVDTVSHAVAQPLTDPGTPDPDEVLVIDSVRASVLVTPEQGFLGSYTRAGSVLALGALLLAVTSTFLFGSTRLRVSTKALLDVGLSVSRMRRALWLAATVSSFSAAACGAVIGLLVGFGLRPLVDHLVVDPISPYPSVTALLLLIGVITAAGCALGHPVICATTRARSGPRPKDPVRARRLRRTRRGVAFIGSAGIVATIGTLDALSRASLFILFATGVTLLLTPEILAGAERLLPQRNAQWILSRRQLAADRSRATVSVAVLVGALGVPLAFLTLISTAMTAAQADSPASAPSGQVVINGPSLQTPADQNLRRIVAADLPPTTPIELGYLNTAERITSFSGEITTLVTADSIEDVGRLAGEPLTPAQARVLQEGGVLRWAGDEQAPGPLQILDNQDGRVLQTLPEVPLGVVQLPAYYQAATSGVMLTATAEQLQLPHTDLTRVAFIDLPEGAPDAAREAVRAAGYDPYPVAVHQDTPLVRAPVAYVLTAAALGALVLITVTGLARSQAESFRRVGASLLALGIPHRWARKVLAVDVGLLLAVATAMSVFLAVPLVGFVVSCIPGYQLTVPWAWLGTVVGAFYVAAGAATVLAMRGLTPAERMGP